MNYIDPTTGLFGSTIVGFSDGEIVVNVPEPSTLVVFLLGLLLVSSQKLRTRAGVRNFVCSPLEFGEGRGGSVNLRAYRDLDVCI